MKRPPPALVALLAMISSPVDASVIVTIGPGTLKSGSTAAACKVTMCL
jgi:hypothetical protein